jgi:hypothetical protein
MEFVSNIIYWEIYMYISYISNGPSAYSDKAGAANSVRVRITGCYTPSSEPFRIYVYFQYECFHVEPMVHAAMSVL